ncbi:MAG TPA: HEAT repeat domain-containing protein [Coriobacteriia bacterium]
MSASAGVRVSEDELIALVGGGDAVAAASAATVLGLHGGERVLGALLELLHHPVAAARASAAMALGLLGVEKAIPHLRTAMSDPDSTVAAHASLALRRLGDDDSEAAACAALASEMRSDDPDRRSLAARALGGLSGPLAAGPLLGALDDPAAQVRADAACSLGWIGDERATAPLTRLGFTDPDPFVREVAMHAIARLVVPGTPV